MSAVFKPDNLKEVSTAASQEAYFEPMTHAHLEAVAQLEQSAYRFPWTQGNFSDSLKCGYHMQMLMAGQAVPGLTGGIQSSPVLIGYFVAMKGVDETHLLNITVAPAYQRQGWGHLLLDALALWSRGEGAQWLWLEVRPSNAHAKAVYLRYGFREVGLRKGYYPDGGSGLLGAARREDAVVMSLALNAIGAAQPVTGGASADRAFAGSAFAGSASVDSASTRGKLP